MNNVIVIEEAIVKAAEKILSKKRNSQENICDDIDTTFRKKSIDFRLRIVNKYLDLYLQEN